MSLWRLGVRMCVRVLVHAPYRVGLAKYALAKRGCFGGSGGVLDGPRVFKGLFDGLNVVLRLRLESGSGQG